MSLKPVDMGREFGPHLSGRASGRAAGQELADRLANTDGLVLSFWRVITASSPFLDEVVFALHGVLRGGDSGRQLLIAGCSEDVEDVLKLTLQRNKLKLAAASHNGALDLLGATPHLAETLDAASILGEFTVPELAARLELKLPALHQRLIALTEAGAVSRVPDPTVQRGRRHVYRVVPKLEIRKHARRPADAKRVPEYAG